MNIKLVDILNGDRDASELSGKQVLIWTEEHRAFWRENKSGYTNFIQAAGEYSFEEAFSATKHCDPSKEIEYLEITGRTTIPDFDNVGDYES